MRLALCILFGLAALPAHAAWVKYAENERAAYYFDPDTVRTEENVRKVWELQDYKQRDQNGAMSQRFWWEIECKARTFRSLATSLHSEPQLEGKILELNSMEGPIAPIAPDSNIEAIRAQVCAR